MPRWRSFSALAAALAIQAALPPAFAQPVGDSDRVEEMWRDTHRIMPGVYHLNRQVSFDVNGIKILHLDGVVFDGSAMPSDAPWLTQFCSAQRLQNIVGGVWKRENKETAIQVNRNPCSSAASRLDRAKPEAQGATPHE